MNSDALTDFANRYATAWSGQNAASVADFFEEDGSLQINAGATSVGRAAIAAAAQSFMTAFPNMVVSLDRVCQRGEGAIFEWTLTGVNTGPSGTGRPVRISGYEEWQFGTNGLIGESQGHFDDADYRRQLSGK
ncbi:MAG: nuclear transport factor 2 family protein [Bryobacteraceae bacterium]|nr:nuclear transport factor 2 family protein [Bryobacteraceae bacterium]